MIIFVLTVKIKLYIYLPVDCAVHLIEEDILIVFDKILLPNHSPVVNENENISFEINFISIISHIIREEHLLYQ